MVPLFVRFVGVIEYNCIFVVHDLKLTQWNRQDSWVELYKNLPSQSAQLQIGQELTLFVYC